jgi:NodT family efflux transporter outer membrane factor (OMF) lipoprotein
MRPGRVGLAVALLAAGCSVGPNYVRPGAPAPAAFKEAAGWKIAEPRDEAAHGPWWTVYDDETLARLEAAVESANQNVAAAEARFREARALVSAARASWYPTVTVGVSAGRARGSENLSSVQGRGFGGRTESDFTMPLSVSWELDVWGRIRREVESRAASAQASAADLASTQLSLQAELAIDYFRLRTLDAQRRLFDASVDAFAKSLELTRNRYAGGVASRADVVQAETQLASTRAQAIDLGVERAQTEHAIAVLTGQSPAELSLEYAPLNAAPPDVPPGVPAALLERRPDVAAAERRVAAANAEIGVAQAAYFPTVELSATGGFESNDIAKWLVWPSRFWSFGPSVSETVFDGGARGALTAQARATYDETVATYRQSTLAAFEQVEDALAALRLLEEEARIQNEAVTSAREAVRILTNQYKAGIAGYLEVVITQAAALANERTAVDILGRRLAASVLLVEALGGGWRTDDLPPQRDLAAD